MEHQTEEWRQFRKTRYEVSNTGKVRRGKRILKPQSASTQRSYYQVRIFNGIDKLGKLHYVHRMVVECFIGKIPKGMEVNHINADTKDNRVENLEIVTKEENLADFYISGNSLNKGQSKLTKDDVHNIRYVWTDDTIASIARRLNVTRNSVYRVRKRETWNFVP